MSVGCVGYSSSHGAACGVGVGWIKTDLFNAESNKHGLGIYAGIVYVDRYTPQSNDRYSKSVQDNLYGPAISYSYFTNGINQSGFNFGTSFYVMDDNSDSLGGFALQMGYQF